MSNEKVLTIKETFDLAVQKHQNNNLRDAQSYYQKVLELDPNYANAHNNLGVIFQGLGENQKAKDYFEKAIEINPDYVDAYNNLGAIFGNLGENQKVKDCFEKVIKIDPNYTSAHFNLGVMFKQLGENQKAINCYEKAIEIDPNYADAHYGLGVIFQELEESQKAKGCFEKTIKISPSYANAHNNLGAIFKELGEYQKAKDSFERAIEINPDYVDAHNNLSTLYTGTLTDLDKAINTSYLSLKLICKKSNFKNQSVPLFRLKHDVQQANYLHSKDHKIDSLVEFQKVGGEILSRRENKEDENNYNKKILLTQVEINALLPFYKSDYIYKSKKISTSCINPNKNWQDVEDEYFNSSNQIMFIDDFLSDEALKELREFCLVSKVWNLEYSNKYLGAFSDQGFISPIHLQIAIELKQKLPKLFGPHRIEKFWGFKYDSTLGKGINIHADFAIHNLNFWITPDKYNNNKNSGGLKVYDAPAPDHWTFKNYNKNSEEIYKFLADSNAKCINIPYKFNRAVLFNSAYFHETDEIDFKDEYEGRRINNTYLFGTRLVK